MEKRTMTNVTLVHADLLGDFTVRFQCRSRVYPPTSKNGALFAFLILNPSRDHIRSRVADMFWSDTNDPRGNLRRALSTIREDLASLGYNADGIFVSTRDHIRLNPDALRTDISEFRKLARRAAN